MSDIKNLIQRLRTRNGRPDGFGLGLTCDEAADALEAMSKDAARYRWLSGNHGLWLLKRFQPVRPYLSASEVVDDSIDAAMAEDAT